MYGVISASVRLSDHVVTWLKSGLEFSTKAASAALFGILLADCICPHCINGKPGIFRIFPLRLFIVLCT